ncbi:MAG TPA: tRNA (N6-threonylcarbamoyladenosine(37)-N6)-methyltransferase TrmO [Methanobacteriaceae archaeon]|nr:tRNA (N6-threonylcarbamoyladenosine(37)-N6)-methyltransferase TrmO [Methanobacteriaceae archaeon]
MEEMTLKPVGIIHSPFKEKKDSPRQGRYGLEKSEIEIFEEYVEALDGIEKYENLIILYWLDKAERDLLKVVPAGKSKKRGVFSTRAPSRPNPIAFSLVDLLEVNKNKLIVKGLEALDSSLLVDIKPYWKDIDSIDSSNEL